MNHHFYSYVLLTLSFILLLFSILIPFSLSIFIICTIRSLISWQITKVTCGALTWCQCQQALETCPVFANVTLFSYPYTEMEKGCVDSWKQNKTKHFFLSYLDLDLFWHGAQQKLDIHLSWKVQSLLCSFS